MTIPTLSDWKETTGLPWFGFWARELLRWGTHDPLVAFSLSQGLAKTREEASGRRPAFEQWLRSVNPAPAPDDHIDPQRFLEWQETLPRTATASTAVTRFAANLTGTNGQRGRYAVMPVLREGGVAWIDAAGFELAVTPASPGTLKLSRRARGSDYVLETIGPSSSVVRSFRPS